MAEPLTALDRRRKLRTNVVHEEDELAFQIKNHQELLRYAAVHAKRCFGLIQNSTGKLEKDEADLVCNNLINLFFDGYLTRKAVANEAIQKRHGDPYSFSALEEMLRDTKTYEPVLRKYMDSGTLKDSLQVLKKRHPEVVEYVHESAALTMDAVHQTLDMTSRLDDTALTYIANQYKVMTYLGYLVRQEIENSPSPQ